MFIFKLPKSLVTSQKAALTEAESPSRLFRPRRASGFLLDLKSPGNAHYSCPDLTAAQKQTPPLGNPVNKGLDRKRLEIKGK